MGNVQSLGFLFLFTGIGMVLFAGLVSEGIIVGLIGGVLLWARKKDSEDGR